MSFMWKITSYFLVKAEMFGTLDVVSTYLANTFYRRLLYCQTSRENSDLAFLHMSLVYTGVTENQDMFELWL